MARIKIKDLPKDMKISPEEMRGIYGGPEYLLDMFRLDMFNPNMASPKREFQTHLFRHGA